MAVSGFSIQQRSNLDGKSMSSEAGLGVQSGDI